MLLAWAGVCGPNAKRSLQAKSIARTRFLSHDRFSTTRQLALGGRIFSLSRVRYNTSMPRMHAGVCPGILGPSAAAGRFAAATTQ